MFKKLKNLELFKKELSDLNLNHNGLFFRHKTSYSKQERSLSLLSITTGNNLLKKAFSSEAKKAQPPIGVSNFREIIEHRDFDRLPYLFVDKSLFIKDLLADSTKVKLIPRPRRFGKTLNMSLLHHFFSKEVNGKPTADLFKELKISQYEECMKYQGQYPVISLTFKDIKSGSFKSAYDDLYEIIRRAFLEHEKQILSPTSTLNSRDKQDYEIFLDRKASDSDKRASLQKLTFYLSECYGVKPIILIDECDTPFQTAYIENYYQDMLKFMREFFGTGLTDNSYFDRAILTGVLPVPKESLFSGQNNLKVYSLLNSRYGEYFGFTEDEVYQLLDKTNLKHSLKDVRTWYNGYQAGNVVIYNPWSIVNYIQEQGRLSPYWVNTSDNSLIKDLLINSSTNFKEQFESLIKGDPVEKFIDEQAVLEQFKSNESSSWALLLMSGYLKVTSTKDTKQGSLYQLEIPNKEVRDLYRMFVAEWLSGVNDATVFYAFLENFLNGNMEDFEENLKSLMLQTFSVRDIKEKNPEKFFHGFMLGLISGIDQKQYKIGSNKESALGRYDIIIAPNDSKKLGIILEIKSIDKDNIQSLKEAADNVVKQIDDQKYTMTPLLKNIHQYLKVGIAFSEKELTISYRKDTHYSKTNIKPQNN